MVRRVVAAVAILVVLILIVVGVHSCQVSARNTSLKDYANNMSNAQQRVDGDRQRPVFQSAQTPGSANAPSACRPR